MNLLINPKAIIDATPLNLSQLLSPHEFIIPDYQRDYVWKEPQVKQIWHDIKDLYQRSTKRDEIIDHPEGYFLGSMVAIESPDQPNALEIVDGQQRLTTLTCLAIVLLDQVNTRWISELRATMRTLEPLVGIPKSGKEYCRITFPDSEINDFFENSTIKFRGSDRRNFWETDPTVKALLLNSKSPASRVAACINYFENEVKLFIKISKHKKKRIQSLSILISECLVFLLIRAKSTGTAYDLFEGLNYRGMPLSQSDLVKNIVIKESRSDSDKKNVVEIWNEVKISLSEHDLLSLPDFLHYSFLSRHEFLRAKKLFEGISQKICSGYNTVAFSRELLEDASALEKLIKGDTTLWCQKTNDSLRDLHEVLNIKLAYIPLLAAFRKHSRNSYAFLKHVSAIINFVFRYMKIMDGDVGGLAQIMYESAKKINSGENVSKLMAFLKDNAPDARFKTEFKNYSVGSAKLGYYIVSCIELPRLSGTSPLNHGESQHLEHIMPKAPTLTHWPDAHRAKKSSPESYHKTIWSIGNLLPLPRDINSAIQNKPISFKIRNGIGKSYEKCDLQSPKEVEGFLDSGKWTEKSIQDRQNDLAENHILNAWPL